MTILLESDILKSIEKGDLSIEPFCEESLQPASYDLRADQEYTIQGLTLVSTMETVELPEDMAGIVRMRSTFGREGVFLSGGYIDPGYKGDITLCLMNAEVPVEIKEGEGVSQIIFFSVSGSTKGYSGKYQNSKGSVESKRS